MNKNGIDLSKNKAKLNVFETFSGIGSQHKALKNSFNEKKFEIVATSEWEIYAIIAYDAIHKGAVLHKDLEKLLKYWKINSKLKLSLFLSIFSFSKNGEKEIDINKIIDKEPLLAQRLAIAMKRNNNIGSILDFDKNRIDKDINLLTYSFPCQDLSIASMGRGKGMARGSENRSGLLWKVLDILESYTKENLPEFLLLENVPNMLSQKHKSDYDEWIFYLESKGYKTITKILDARNYGIPQSRRRVFAISFNTSKLNIDNFEGLVVKYDDHLKKQQDNFFINNELIKKVNNKIKDSFLSLESHNDEAIKCLMKNTPSREKMLVDNKDLLLDNLTYFRTLTKKQDRNPNVGYIRTNFDKPGYLKERFITPREAYKIMGFTDKDFDNTKNDLFEFSKEKYYSQAGNSIVVNVLEAIFKFVMEVWDEKDNK